MAQKQLRSDVVVATQTFFTAKGKLVRRGDTFERGHPILEGHTAKTKPFEVKYPLPEPEPEPATPAPAEQPAKPET